MKTAYKSRFCAHMAVVHAAILLSGISTRIIIIRHVPIIWQALVRLQEDISFSHYSATECL